MHIINKYMYINIYTYIWKYIVISKLYFHIFYIIDWEQAIQIITSSSSRRKFKNYFKLDLHITMQTVCHVITCWKLHTKLVLVVDLKVFYCFLLLPILHTFISINRRKYNDQFWLAENQRWKKLLFLLFFKSVLTCVTSRCMYEYDVVGGSFVNLSPPKESYTAVLLLSYGKHAWYKYANL